jgi:hypothetical protein
MALLAALLQMVLGADPLVVAVALCTAFVGLFSFVVFGAYNLGSWVALFYVLGNVLIALYGKTLFLQTLDSHLYAPMNSYFSVAVSSISLLIALLVIRHLSVGPPLFKSVTDTRFLGFLSWACFFLGAFFWLLNSLFQDPEGNGFGGIALFRDLLFMAVIARTAMLLERSGDHQSYDNRLGLILAVSIFMGLVDNSKTAAALPVFSYFATVLFYRRRLPVRQVAVLVIGGVLFVTVVAPMVHALRLMGQQEMSFQQRIDFVASNAVTLFEGPQTLNRFQSMADSVFGGGYYNYFGESGAGQMLLGRYTSIQQIDPVIAAVDLEGPRGGAAIWPAFARLVPGFIYPDKPRYGEGYNTLVHYGLINPVGGKFPTLPLAGQAYAAYGVVGLLFIPFLTFFGFFLCVKKLGWQLYRNIYAIFFFCDFVIVYVNQGNFGQYAGAILRNFPLFAIVFVVIILLYRIRIQQRPLSRASVVKKLISGDEHITPQ